MSKLLTEDAVARYRRDGVHWPVPVLTADEVAHYRGCLEGFERSQGGPLRGLLENRAARFAGCSTSMIAPTVPTDAKTPAAAPLRGDRGRRGS